MAFRLTSLCRALAALALASLPLAPARAETALDRISRTGEVQTVVMDGDLPFTTRQADGYAGLAMEFNAEIQKELSEYIGRPVALKPQPVTSVEQGLASVNSGKADLACGVSFSWGRSMFVDYSLPFALSGVRLLTPAGHAGTPAALKGQRIGVVKDSVASQTLAQAVPGAQLVPFANPNAALAALKAGQIRFLAGDTLWLMANRAGVDPTANLAPAVPYNRTGVACILPEHNSGLLNLTNLAIARLMQAYIDDRPDAQQRINRWVGPGSSVNLSPSAIKAYFTNVLLTAAQIDLP